MEVVNFCYKRLHLRFCGSPRYASDVTIWVIHYVSNLFSFSFSLHGAHKKRKLFQTFLFLIKKTSTPLVNPIGTCSILFFLLFVAATNPKASVVSLPQIWQPLLLPVWMTLLFFLRKVISSSVVIAGVATVIVLDDGSGSRSGSITEWYSWVFPIFQVGSILTLTLHLVWTSTSFAWN